MAETTMEEVISLEGELIPCEICGRTFLEAPLAKHRKVCERNVSKQRRVFDSQKQRVEGTDFAPFHQTQVKKSITGTPYAVDAFKKVKWKEKHLELVKTIRAARGVVDMTTHSASATSLTHDAPGTERCPSCDRQFGPRAYDRHVEWCKEHVAYVHRSPAQVLLAKERLEARIKYRVPAPKSKRAVVKEKYSPSLGSRTDSLTSIKSCTYLDQTPKIQKQKSVVALKKLNDASNYNHGDSVEVIKKNEKVKKNSTNFNDHIDPTNSHHMNRLLIQQQKVNTVAVNNTVEGLTVQPINSSESKGLVTWNAAITNPPGEKVDFNQLADKKIFPCKSQPCNSSTFQYLRKKHKEKKFEEDSELLDTNLIKSFLTSQFTKIPIRSLRSLHANKNNTIKNCEGLSSVFAVGKSNDNVINETVQTSQVKVRQSTESISSESVSSETDPIQYDFDKNTSKAVNDFDGNENTPTELLYQESFENSEVDSLEYGVTKKIKWEDDSCNSNSDMEVDDDHINLTMYKRDSLVQKMCSEQKYISLQSDPIIETQCTSSNYDNVHRMKNVSAISQISSDMSPSTVNEGEITEPNIPDLQHNTQIVVEQFSVPVDIEAKVETDLSAGDDSSEGSDDEILKYKFDNDSIDLTMYNRDSLQANDLLETVQKMCKEEKYVSLQSDHIMESQCTSSSYDNVHHMRNASGTSQISSVMSLPSNNVLTVNEEITEPSMVDLQHNTKIVVEQFSVPVDICEAKVETDLSAGDDNSEGSDDEILKYKLDNDNTDLTMYDRDSLQDSDLLETAQKMCNKEKYVSLQSDHFIENQCTTSDYMRNASDTSHISLVMSLPSKNISSVNEEEITEPNISVLQHNTKIVVEQFSVPVGICETKVEGDDSIESSDDEILRQKLDYHNIDIHKDDTMLLASERTTTLSKFEDLENWNTVNPEIPNKTIEFVPSNQNCCKNVDFQNIPFFTKTNSAKFGTKLNLSVDSIHNGEENTNVNTEFIPRKRRKYSDNSTTILPVGVNYNYNLSSKSICDTAIFTKSVTSSGISVSLSDELIDNSEKANQKISPRLLALINIITNEKCENSNRSSTDQLLTISVGDCRRLLELDPNIISMENKLPKMDLKKDIICKDSESSKLTLPLIAKAPVKNVLSDKNVSSCSSIVSLPQIVPKSTTQSDYNPFLTAERQLMELLECEDFKPFINKTESTKVANRPHTVSGSKMRLTEANHHNNNNKFVKSAENTRKKLDKNGESTKRVSVIDPPTDFQDGDDFELIESLINQNYLEGYNLLDEINENTDEKMSDHHINLPIAYLKFNDDSPIIDPRLINENDNLAIPDNLIVHHSSSNSSNDNLAPSSNVINQRSSSVRHLTRSSETLYNTTASRGFSPNSKATKSAASNSKLTKSKKPTVVRKPSVSLHSSSASKSKNLSRPDIRKPVTSFKKSLSVQEAPKSKSKFKHDSGFETLNKPTTPATNIINEFAYGDFAKSEDLFEVDDVMLEEFKKFEENYLKDKDEQRRKKEKGLQETSINLDNVTDGPISKSNIDSAYNRSTTKVRAKPNSLSPLEFTRPEISPTVSPASSGSDTVSVLCEPQKRVSKFCHECGTKYPIATAKFCVECGVKRLVL